MNKGVSVLKPGETLYVRAGIYLEQLFNNIPAGTSWASPVTVSGYPGETVTLKAPPGSQDSVINIWGGQSQYIVIENLIVDATAGPGGITLGTGSGGATDFAHHVRIKNVEIFGSPESGGLMSWGNGSGFHEFINLNVHDNGLIRDSTGLRNHGTYLSTSDNVIDGGSYWRNGSHGILFYSSPSVGFGPQRNTIRNAKIYQNNDFGIGLYGWGTVSEKDKIYNNLIYSNGMGINATNAFIANNTLYENITNPDGQIGINLNYAHGSEAINNIVQQSQGTGINVENTNGATVKNNISTGSATNYNDRGGGTTASGNLFGAQYDPRFVNASAFDFRLQAGSPAINTGLLLSSVFTTDIVGAVRDTLWDTGAYEFGGANSIHALIKWMCCRPWRIACGDPDRRLPQSSFTFPHCHGLDCSEDVQSSHQKKRAQLLSPGAARPALAAAFIVSRYEQLWQLRQS